MRHSCQPKSGNILCCPLAHSYSAVDSYAIGCAKRHIPPVLRPEGACATGQNDCRSRARSGACRLSGADEVACVGPEDGGRVMTIVPFDFEEQAARVVMRAKAPWFVDEWSGRADASRCLQANTCQPTEPHDQGSDRETLPRRRPRPDVKSHGQLHQRLQLRAKAEAEDPQGPHAPRGHLQTMDNRTRKVHPKSHPSNAGTERLIYEKHNLRRKKRRWEETPCGAF